ncbi:MAG: ribosome biogenesis protein [Nitrososphaerales archaeon]
MLSLIIAEAALETVPKVIAEHASVAKHAHRKGKSVQEILLDRSYHHAAMIRLDNGEKRGRPDLVHFALLEATSTPLYQKGMLKIYLHTIGDKVIFFHETVRLPKSYFRFEGLMEELFKDRRIESNSGLLMELKDLQFADLLHVIKPTTVIGLSGTGLKSSVEEVAKSVEHSSALIIGGFPHSHFSSKVSSKLDHLYSISENRLEAHVVIARILYEYEKKLV